MAVIIPFFDELLYQFDQVTHKLGYAPLRDSRAWWCELAEDRLTQHAMEHQYPEPPAPDVDESIITTIERGTRNDHAQRVTYDAQHSDMCRWCTRYYAKSPELL